MGIGVGWWRERLRMDESNNQLEYLYEDLALAVAQSVYKFVQKDEKLADGVYDKNVNNMGAGYYEPATHILMHFGILKPIDNLGIRSKFLLQPNEFKEKIKSFDRTICSRDQLISSLCLLLEQHPNDDDTFFILKKLGIVDEEETPYVKEYFDKVSGKRQKVVFRQLIWSQLREKYYSLSYPKFIVK